MHIFFEIPPPTVKFRERGGDVFFTIASLPAQVPTQPPIQWVPGLFPRKQGDRRVNLTTRLHLLRKLRMPGAIAQLPHTSSWSGV